MERTNYVAKAKSLMKKAALVVVPLAMAAAASATSVVPTLPTANFGCSINSGSACAGGAASINTPTINGVEFFTLGTITLLHSGSGTSGSFFRDMMMSTSATSFFAFLPATLPVFYDFTLEGHSGAVIDSWSLTFGLSGRYGGTVNFSGTGAGTFSGQGSVDLTSSSDTTLFVYTILSVQGSRPDTSGFVTVDVPVNGSFDFGASAAVPEPATAGIVAAGLTMAGLFHRRRRRT